MVREIIGILFDLVIPLIIGFEVGYFYSKERFEKEYRDGFKRGYCLGKMDKGEHE